MDTYKITGMKEGVKNKNRVNIYIDSKFEFSLDIQQVVDFQLKVGQDISNEKLEKLKRASEFGKLYQRTLEWVLLRPHSEKECRDYLHRKLRQSSSAKGGFSSLWSSEDISKLSYDIILRLKDKKYLDDYRFAEWYVENRFLKKGVSLKRLTMELVKKGISKEIIDEVLDKSGRNDKEEIRKVIAKKRVKYPDDQKLIAYLARQGFDYSLVRELVAELSSGSMEE